MSRRSFLQSGKRGSILVLMVIVAVLLLVAGIGMLRCGLQARVFAAREADKIAAQVAADTGVVKALWEMNQMLATMSENDSSAFPKPTDTPLDNCDATYSYKINANSIKAAIKDGTTISSTGRSGRAEKTVYATVQLSNGPFEFAIFAKSGMTLKPNIVVDGYNSDIDKDNMNVPVEIGTNSIEDASITAGDGAIINGDVVVGYGGEPDDVISADKATITGNTTALSEEQELPSVTVPLQMQALPAQPTITEPILIASSGKYDGINLGVGQTITIDGPVTLYVTGNIGLGKSAAIEINQENPDASLTLYLGGDLYCKNGGMLNNFTEDPKRLKIYALDSCNNMSFATAGVFYGAIYAPNSPIYLKSSLEIYGSVVADIFAQGSTSNFHYDASLKDEGADFWPQRFEVTRWWEE